MFPDILCLFPCPAEHTHRAGVVSAGMFPSSAAPPPAVGSPPPGSAPLSVPSLVALAGAVVEVSAWLLPKV